MKAWKTSGLAALLLAAGALFVPSSAEAADIKIARSGGMIGILVSGDLELGDEIRFAEAALRLDSAVVLLDGPGGNLHAGMQIGRAIRLKGFTTVVPGSCASACALAWLAGRKRFVGTNGRVGFHAAFRQGEDGTLSVTSTGNALIGAYLSQLGFAPETIVFLTSTAPEKIDWMTMDEARRHGIEVGVLPSTPDEPRRRVARVPSPPPVAAMPKGQWASFGEWVQAASRPRLADAIAFAETTRRRNGNTSVFRHANGWYVVVVGPFSPGRGDVALNALVGAGEVPDDSLVVQGERFDELAWGYVPTPKSAARQAGWR